MSKQRGGVLLALALACGAVDTGPRRSDVVGEVDPVREGVRRAVVVRTEEDQARLHGRLRREQLEARYHRPAARNEASRCPSVTSIDYADGQGNTQKAISDIQGMVAKGLNAIVVFPDAGKAILPALRSSYKAGVVTVPYRVTPVERPALTTTSSSTPPSRRRARTGAGGSCVRCRRAATCSCSAARKETVRASRRTRASTSILDPTHKYKFIGEQPFEVTNWVSGPDPEGAVG